MTHKPQNLLKSFVSAWKIVWKAFSWQELTRRNKGHALWSGYAVGIIVFLALMWHLISSSAQPPPNALSNFEWGLSTFNQATVNLSVDGASQPVEVLHREDLDEGQHIFTLLEPGSEQYLGTLVAPDFPVAQGRVVEPRASTRPDMEFGSSPGVAADTTMLLSLEAAGAVEGTYEITWEGGASQQALTQARAVTISATGQRKGGDISVNLSLLPSQP